MFFRPLKMEVIHMAGDTRDQSKCIGEFCSPVVTPQPKAQRKVHMKLRTFQSHLLFLQNATSVNSAVKVTACTNGLAHLIPPYRERTSMVETASWSQGPPEQGSHSVVMPHAAMEAVTLVAQVRARPRAASLTSTLPLCVSPLPVCQPLCLTTETKTTRTKTFLHLIWFSAHLTSTLSLWLAFLYSSIP